MDEAGKDTTRSFIIDSFLNNLLMIKEFDK